MGQENFSNQTRLWNEPRAKVFTAEAAEHAEQAETKRGNGFLCDLCNLRCER